MYFQAGMKNYLKNISANGSENEFPPAKIRLVFKIWFPLMSVTFSASRKELSSRVDYLY